MRYLSDRDMLVTAVVSLYWSGKGMLVAAAVAWKLVPYKYFSDCCRVKTSIVSLDWSDKGMLLAAAVVWKLVP